LLLCEIKNKCSYTKYICIYGVYAILFFAVLGFELRALNLISKHYSTWTMQSTLFALLIFQIESRFYSLADLDLNPPIYTSMTAMYHHAQIFIGWDGVSQKFLPNLSLNHNSSGLQLPCLVAILFIRKIVSSHDQNKFKTWEKHLGFLFSEEKTENWLIKEKFTSYFHCLNYF
jgi:hypothetical protein